MDQNSGFILDGVYILKRSLQTQFKKEKDMDQNYSLFALIFKGVHELFEVHTGWSIYFSYQIVKSHTSHSLDCFLKKHY